MAYNDFTLEGATRSFGLGLVEEIDLFSDVPPVEVTGLLRATLEESVPLAASIPHREGAVGIHRRPILAEIRRQTKHRVSLFSGIAFDVDRERGLNGTCDFLLARSPVQLYLESPVMAVVEAKNDNIKSGYGQCVAEMVAARLFNERAGQAPRPVFGAVTTGTLWRFLKLDGSSITIDRAEYHLGGPEKVVGILLHCVESDP